MTYKAILSLVILQVLFSANTFAQSPDVQKTSGGLEYRLIVDKPGDQHPKVGDYVTMHLKSTLGDSVLYNSRELNNDKAVTFQLMKPSYKGDLTEGIMALTPGDSAHIYIPVDDLIKSGSPKLSYMKQGVGQKLEYRVVLVSVKPMAQMKKEQEDQQKKQAEIDDKKLIEYFKTNNITPKKTASGLYYTIDRLGEGDAVNKGDKVTVNYTGKTIDGKVFDSNIDPSFMHVEPFTFILGMGHVIKGWDEGVDLLNKGTKATLYIPSRLAYGKNSPDPNKIPENAIMIFDIEVLYSPQDSLRGSNGYGRSWWDVQKYELTVGINPNDSSISGFNTITYKVTDPQNTGSMQIDLQDSMMIDRVLYNDQRLGIKRDGNVWWINTRSIIAEKDKEYQITVYYHGKPRIAKMPPWQGGFIWTKDSEGKPWYSVACQGLGASSWWPCKDYQGDEPDNGMEIEFLHKKGLTYVSNGRQISYSCDGDQCKTVWGVKNPINTYNATFYAGNYISWTDTLMGENGKLDLSYYVLEQNEKKAKKQFKIAKDMLHCFEYWMGPYPFYEDGYKLVEAPHLGMEHQSAIAYGNEYKNGYRGMDRSGTGIGTLFDFIIIHESGHEWFGNNITAKDIADNWLHEGFTTYTEALFVECAYGKKKAYEYVHGQWKQNIRNDKPIIGTYGVHEGGSTDQYDKGAAIVHMIRVMMDDDTKFRALLRGLNKDFHHQMVTSAQVEDYIMEKTGLKLEPFFNQYLRTADIPELEWYVKDKRLHYRFTNVVTEFKLPLEVSGGKENKKIIATSEWQDVAWKKAGYNISFSKDFLIKPKP